MIKNIEIPILTIDGPSGSGKGTISRSVAGQLGWHLLDSGALYRLVAWSAHLAHVPRKWSHPLERVVLDLNVKFDTDEAGDERILLDDEDVTFNIRTEECGHMASEVAAIPEVRLALVQLQRGFQKPPGLVADGRDMGTVIFPEAGVKIFLTAKPEERAQRRYKQLKEKGIDVSLAALREDIVKRDERDSKRKAAPLKPADDAIQIDTTGLSIPEVVELVTRMANHEFNLDL